MNAFICDKCGAMIPFEEPVHAVNIDRPGVVELHRSQYHLCDKCCALLRRYLGCMDDKRRPCSGCEHEGLVSNDCSYCNRHPSLLDKWAAREVG